MRISEEGDNDEADDDIGSLHRKANFLLGTVSQFGRTVRFNNNCFLTATI